MSKKGKRSAELQIEEEPNKLARTKKYTVYNYLNDPDSNIDKSLGYCSPVGLVALHEIISYVKDPSNDFDIHLEQNLEEIMTQNPLSEKPNELSTRLEQFLNGNYKDKLIRELIIEFVKRRLRISRPGDGNNHIIQEQKALYNGYAFLKSETRANKSQLKMRIDKTNVQSPPIRALIKSGEPLIKQTRESKYCTVSDVRLCDHFNIGKGNCTPICIYCSKEATGNDTASSHLVGVKPAFLYHKSTPTYAVNFLSCHKQCNATEDNINPDYGKRDYLSFKEKLNLIRSKLGSQEFKYSGDSLFEQPELREFWDEVIKNIDMFEKNELKKLSKLKDDLELKLYKDRLGLAGFKNGVWVIDTKIIHNMVEKSNQLISDKKEAEKDGAKREEIEKLEKKIQQQIELFKDIKNKHDQQINELGELEKELTAKNEKLSHLGNEYVEQQKILATANSKIEELGSKIKELEMYGHPILNLAHAATAVEMGARPKHDMKDESELEKMSAVELGDLMLDGDERSKKLQEELQAIQKQKEILTRLQKELTDNAAQNMTNMATNMDVDTKSYHVPGDEVINGPPKLRYKKGRGKTEKRKKRFENIKKNLPKTMKRLNKIKLKGLKGLNTIRQTFKNKKNKIKHALTFKNKQKKSKILKLKKPGSKKEKKVKTVNKQLIINKLFKKPKTTKK